MRRTVIKRFITIAILIFGIIAVAIVFKNGKPAIRIVLITLDTLRYDNFWGRDHQQSDMPLTKNWAKRGLNFTRFYSSTSSTQPTHATIFTGMHPWEHGAMSMFTVLPKNVLAVAEIFQQNGFSTHAVVASIALYSNWGFAQGFEDFLEPFTHSVPVDKWERWKNVCTDCNGNLYTLANTVTDQAIRLLNKEPTQNRFFWFHYFDPHAPYGDTDGKEEFPSKVTNAALEGGNVDEELAEIRRLYDIDTRYLDHQLDRLFKYLEKSAEGYETHVILTTDHAELFGEDGSLEHTKRIILPAIHVPTFILSPWVTGQIRTDIAGSIDIMPTLLSFAGLKFPTLHGRNLLKAPSYPQEAFGMRETFQQGVTELRTDGKKYAIEGYLFYHVGSDGKQTRGNSNMLIEHRSRREEKNLMKIFSLFENAAEHNTVKVTVDPVLKEKLKSLGYLQ